MPPPPVHILLNRQLAMQSSRLSQLGHKIQPHVILELENVEWDLSSVSYSWGGGGGHERGAQVHGQERGSEKLHLTLYIFSRRGYL